MYRHDEYDNDDLYEQQDYNSFNEEDEEEDEDISLEKENKIINNLDPDLIEFFNEAQVIKRKSFGVSKNKKNKKDKEIYPMGLKVKVGNKECSILYGPYELNGKDMYEVETESGNVISAEYNKIQKL